MPTYLFEEGLRNTGGYLFVEVKMMSAYQIKELFSALFDSVA